MAAQEDKLFEAKIEDCLRLGEKRPAFLGFLDLSERAYAEEYLRRVHAENYRFFGGFPEAERTVLGVFPDYMEPLDEEFPVTGLTVKFRRQDALSQLAEPVPLAIRNAPTKLMKDLNYGKGYQFAHDAAEKLTNMQCLPDSLKEREYYRPTKQGLEAKLRERLLRIKEWKKG